MRRTLAMIVLAVALTTMTACSATPAAAPQPAAQPTITDQTVEPQQNATTIAAAAPDAAPILPTVTVKPATPELPAFDAQTTRITLDQYADGLEMPLFLTHANDGSNRTFILEKRGRIRIVKDGQLLAEPFLDITDRVGSQANEQGLLGLAFAPDYSTSGAFFVNYTNLSGDTVVARYSVGTDANQGDLDSESQVLRIDQPAPNHNGGMIAFGPDEMLYIGMGDGGAANDTFGNGQNPFTLLGKILRLDVSDPSQPYAIPADKPWVASDWNGEDVRDEIWAVGVRNPWRFSFDRANGDLWIADVGQNQYEEVNRIAAPSSGGLNFGWPIMEGTHCFREESCDTTGLEIPVAEYDHSGHCSITGGYVYRGSAYPALHGVYLYGDFCSGTLWAAVPSADGKWISTEALKTGATISSFGEDESGELYLLDYSGVVYRVGTE